MKTERKENLFYVIFFVAILSYPICSVVNDFFGMAWMFVPVVLIIILYGFLEIERLIVENEELREKLNKK